MKIKNIKEYRSFYKNEIRDLPTRDENFIGNFLKEPESNRRKFGWFEIYHGDKEGYGRAEEGIGNFLQSFLDMAKDGQAVYEFLQNAVDAGSTHYSMVWGKDEVDGNHYLLVANNGKMFNLDSVRSILNVGSSTKSNDSHTIGKFGIGFKLAHRLVGKDNGLHELINEHCGPVLFSWKNYEIEQLANGEIIEPVEFSYNSKPDGNFEMADDYPWLFKILITCFPCLPENNVVKELPKMVDGKIAEINPFNTAEYEVLSRWVNKCQHILNKDTYNEGALFFIKLGTGKEEELAEINLKEGVKFAIAILKETADEKEKNSKLLQTVQLNDDEPITYPELEYIKLIVSKETEKDYYAYIRFGANHYEELSDEQKRRMAEEADIEALFGFRKYNEIGDYFKGAPNLYLYFPLSEEVHNFNYILHSNAFYKGSSRTFLHQGNSKEEGINERLLKVIVEKVEEKLIALSESADPVDKNLFLHFYASLLTSGKSTTQNRLWIETPYINPLNGRLKTHIPTYHQKGNENFNIISGSNEVFIKKTDIDIDTQAWGLKNVNWFFWTYNDDFNIILESAKEKLEIRDYTIFDLLKNEGIENQLNNWLNGEEEKIKLVLKELSTITPDKALIDSIKPQLLQLKLFRFSNNALLSLSEFLEKENEGYFLLHNTLGEIKEILHKANLITTVLDLHEYKFVDIYRTFLLQSSKHSGYTELTKLLSHALNDEKLTKLTKDEKLKIFHAVRTFSTDNVNERIKELKLFANNLGRHVTFSSLLIPQSDSWLDIFSISSNEFDDQLKAYLLNERKEYYQNLISPYWADILAYISKNTHKIAEIITEISSLFDESNWSEKSRNLLSNQNLIIFKNEVLESVGIFFTSSLTSLSDKQYVKIQNIALEFYQVHVPDKLLIKYLDTTPLSYASTHFDVQIPKTEASIEKINDLMLYCSICNLDFFATNTISFNNNQYIIDGDSGLKQYSTTKSDVINYVEKYYSGQFILIPDGIDVESEKIEMSGTTLITHLIKIFNEKNMDQELDLIALILKERSEDKKALLETLTYVRLDSSWKVERQNESYLKLLNEINIEIENKEELSNIQSKIIIYEGELEVNIGEIESAQDTIELKRGDKTIYLSQSQILNLESADTIKLIQQFHDEALRRELINPTKANVFFKISKVGINEDLISRFETVLSSLNLVSNALPINNSHQLAFVLLSNNYSSADFKKKFAIKCQNDKWYFLEGAKVVFSEENDIYIKNNNLLNEQYKDLQTVFSLNDLEVFNYGEDEDDIIVSKFLFVKGQNPNLLNPDGELSEKLNYLYNGWKGLSHTLRDYKRDADWEPVLGINPSHYVLNGTHIECEILPNEFLDWCKDDKSKQEFLKGIGFFVNDKFLEPFRQFLSKKTESLPENIDVAKFNDTILLYTLNGLSGDFSSLNNKPIIYDNEDDISRILVIEQIITHLIEKDVECPLLVYNDSNTFHLAKQVDNSIYQIDEDLHLKLKQCQNNNLNLIYSNYYILKSDHLLGIQFIKEEIEEFEFESEFIPSINSEQHNEPFYHNWSKQNNIVLIKENELRFKIYDVVEEEKDYIGEIEEGEYFIDNDDDETTKIFYLKNIHLDGLLSALQNNDESLAKSIQDLISKREIMLANIYNAYNSANIDDVSNEHLQALQEAFREENLKQERQELINEINENTRYSHGWFKSYLDYLLTFSKNTTDNTNPKTIRFQTIKRQVVNDLISNRYFLLCGASSYISDTIEDISDFSLKVTTRSNKVFTPEIEGAQKQGQDLLVYCPKGLGSELSNHLDGVFQIEITFTPQIDLLNELRKAFANETNLNIWEDINNELPSVHFIYGPPGTGKTTTLCKEIINIKKEKNDAKILFLTPTNKAADVLCKKLLVRDVDADNIINQQLEELENSNLFLTAYRVGNPTDPEIERFDPDVYLRSIDHTSIKFADVLAMTIHRLPYTNIFDEDLRNEIKLFKLNNHWDYIIFDEASMINLPYLVFAIMSISKFSPNAKFIIAGDPKQIPPVVDVDDKDLEELDIKDENVYSMMNINSFNREEQILRDCDTIENLNIQYRSIKKIGQLFSELSYSNLLEHNREKEIKLPKKLPEAFQKIINNNVTFVDIPLNTEDSIYKIRKLFGGSSYHIYSAILVAEMIKYFDNQLPENESWSIGLIAPYKAQAVMMNKLITSFGISDKVKVYADTVHGFQGDECDIVFFVCNPNNYYYTGHPKSLLSKEYIYNVAISRAKDYLIIIHPFLEVQNTFVDKIKNSYNSNFEKSFIRKSSDIEKVLFGSNSFIYNNSYITGHDTVNVFGQLEMKYFIKANSNAVDIQLRR